MARYAAAPADWKAKTEHILNLSDVGGEENIEDILGQDREPFAFLEESARSPTTPSSPWSRELAARSRANDGVAAFLARVEPETREGHTAWSTDDEDAPVAENHGDGEFLAAGAGFTRDLLPGHY